MDGRMRLLMYAQNPFQSPILKPARTRAGFLLLNLVKYIYKNN